MIKFEGGTLLGSVVGFWNFAKNRGWDFTRRWDFTRVSTVEPRLGLIAAGPTAG